MYAVVLAAFLFPLDHWALGCWPTGSWGGVEIRPDGLVIERDPDGNVTDLGRWWALGDDDVYWVFLRCPQQTHFLSSDGKYQVDYGYGYHAEPMVVRRGHVPDEWDEVYLIP